MKVVGIDIGVRGAVALLDDGEPIAAWDVPTLDDGPAGRRTINAPLLAIIIEESHAAKAYVEHVGPRPGEGAVGAFAFGRARGVVEGACAARGIPITWLTAPQWKRLTNIPPGEAKDQARSEAIKRWPDRARLFARKCDDGRAEAALIAVAGLLREKRL